MKNLIQALVAISILVGCSGPKYTASFSNTQLLHSEKMTIKPIEPDQLLASTTAEPVDLLITEPEVRKTYVQMNKVEQKELRSRLKQEMKKIVGKTNYGVKSTAAMEGWDDDLKVAAVFGTVGIVALIIGGIVGDLFSIIGAIALLIGVVFFVKWIIRQ